MKYLPLVFVILAGCGAANDTAVNSAPSAVTQADRDFISERVLYNLKDPSSAQLRGLAAYALSNGQGRVVCGEFNAKNSFGAYVGYSPFYLRIKDGRVVSTLMRSGSGDFAKAINESSAKDACARAANGTLKVAGSV